VEEREGAFGREGLESTNCTLGMVVMGKYFVSIN
jgi:hypothetical protein